MELTRRELIKESASIPGYVSLPSTRSRDPLPPWNAGPAKQAIVDFVRATTDESDPKFAPLEDRIATFEFDAVHQRLIDSRLLSVVLVLMVTTSILGPVLTEHFTPRMLPDLRPAQAA